jgi:hypothetical protein
MAHQHRCDVGAEHERRHQHRLEIGDGILPEGHVPGSGQPSQLHRKQQDHQDAKPEVGRRQPPQGKGIGGEVQPGALVDGRDNAGRNADQQRNQHRQHCQLDRHGEFLQDQFQHRLLAANRLAEIALHHTGHPVEVAHRQRLIEVHLLAKVGDDIGVLLLAGEHDGRITGQQLLQPEDQHRHEQQRRQDRRNAPDQVSGQGSFTRTIDPAGSRRHLQAVDA